MFALPKEFLKKLFAGEKYNMWWSAVSGINDIERNLFLIKHFLEKCSNDEIRETVNKIKKFTSIEEIQSWLIEIRKEIYNL